jgi:cellulose synthase operon protein C
VPSRGPTHLTPPPPPSRHSARAKRAAAPVLGSDLTPAFPPPPPLPNLGVETRAPDALVRPPLPPAPSAGRPIEGSSEPPPPPRRKAGAGDSAAPPPSSVGGAFGAVTALGGVSELLAWLDLQLKSESNPQRLGRLHFERAQLHEFPERDFAAARTHYQKAYELIPANEGVIAGLVRVALLLEDYSTALRFMDAQVKQTRAPGEKSQRLLSLGILLEDHLNRPVDARRAYEQAQELAPLDPAVLRALAHRLRAERDFEALDLTLARQAELAVSDPFLRAARVARRARLVELHKKDPELAAELFELSFQAAPDASAALFHLERLHGERGQHVGLAQALTRKTALLTDPEVRATGLERRAHVELDKLGQVDAGLLSLEQAVESSPLDRDLLARLAEQYARSGHPERALVALERLDQLLTDAREQASLRVRAARTCENDLKDIPRALLWYERAREAQPGSPAAVLPLMRIYRQVGAFVPLVQVLLGEEQVTLDLERRAALLAEVAEIYETRLGSAQEARNYHVRALGVLPGYGPSERALFRLYSDARMTPELIEILERAAENATNPEVSERHLLKIATLYEDWLGEHEKALQTYRRILGKNPAHGGALLGAQTAAERAGNSVALVELLEAEAELSPDTARKTTLLVRAADTVRDRLGDPGRAETLYERVLALDSRSKAALGGLVRLFELGGRFEDMVEVRRKEVELASDGVGRAQILYEIADLLESQLGAPDRAVAYLKRAVGADPHHQAARDRLESLLSHTLQFEELLKQLAEDCAQAEDIEARATLWLRQGRLLENVLERPKDALLAYTEALSANSRLRSAREGRLRLLAASGDARTFAAELENDARQASEPRLALWEGLAASEVVLDELGQSQESTQKLEELLRRFPSHPLALLLLEEAYSNTGEREGLVRVLEEQLAHFAGVEQLGALNELLRWGSPERALGYVAALLERQPGHTLALEIKERVALARGDMRALGEAEAALAIGNSSQGLQSQHWLRLAAIEETSDVARALQSYRNALELDPDSVAAARGVGRIASVLSDPQLLVEAAQIETRVTRDQARASGLMVHAARVLDQRGRTPEAVSLLERALEIDPNDRISGEAVAYLLARAGDPARLARTLSAAAQAATDPVSVSQHWMTAARVYEEQLQNRGAALAALGRIEKLVPDDWVALRALGELYLRDRQFAQAAERLERVRGGLDPEARRLVELDLAEIYIEHLGRQADAERILGEVLRETPGERRALRLQFRLLSERRDPGAEAMAQRWAEAADGPERTEAFTALGRLLRDKGSVGQSKDAFLQALPAAGAGAAGPFTDLLALLSNKDESDLLKVVEGLEAHARSDAFFPAERAESAFQAGRLLLERLGQLPRARACLELALELDASHVAARSHLVSCLERGGDLNLALTHAQVLVEIDGLRPEHWQKLRRVLELAGRPLDAELTLGPLTLLGAANEVEQAAYRARPPRAGLVVPGSARDALTALLEPIAEQGGDTLWLFNELSSLGPKVFASGLESLGLTVRDRVTSRVQHPLRPIVDRVLRAFGTPELDLFPVEAHLEAPRLILGDNLGLAVPLGLLNLRESEQVYLLSELMAGVSLGVPLLFTLSEDDLLQTLVAASRGIDPAFSLPGVSGSLELDELTRRIQKAPSWLAKGKFTDRVRRYLGQSGPDARQLIRSVQRSARGVALLLADDLSPLELLHKNPALQDRVGPVELPRVERELLSTWMSLRASRARAQMGL